MSLVSDRVVLCAATGIDLERREHERRGDGAGLRGRGDRVAPQPARTRLRAETPAHAAEAQHTGNQDHSKNLLDMLNAQVLLLLGPTVLISRRQDVLSSVVRTGSFVIIVHNVKRGHPRLLCLLIGP